MSTRHTPARRVGLPVGYAEILQRLAAEVRLANVRATLKVNAELFQIRIIPTLPDSSDQLQ